jgi:hypothetical protein
MDEEEEEEEDEEDCIQSSSDSRLESMVNGMYERDDYGTES